MNYLKLTITNTEPLSISDDSTSHSGQTSCKRYIPGTTLRGYAINSLSEDADFDEIKPVLFSSKVCFLNGYPAVEREENPEKRIELIPSLKGFYENKKAEGPISNVVVDGTFDEGMKRASLGSFCMLDENFAVKYYSVETEDSMKIQISPKTQTGKNDKQKVFRAEAVSKGYTFVSYVAFNEVDEYLQNKICACFNEKTIILGNGRSQGFGKCKVKAEFCDHPKVMELAETNWENGKEYTYMVLLSDLVMRSDDGEYVGLNLNELGRRMTASGSPEIAFCSTSLVTVHGYNATLGIKLPTVPMYEKGSVFKLILPSGISADAMKALMDEGIGERRNEGFGRVLFFDTEHYEKIKTKMKGIISPESDISGNVTLTGEDKDVLKRIAISYYRGLLKSEMEKKILEESGVINIAKSQKGNIISILQNNRYSGNVVSVMDQYFRHATEKEEKQSVHQSRSSIRTLEEKVMDILNSDFHVLFTVTSKKTIMGYDIDSLLNEDEKLQMKMTYLIELLKYERRGDAQ